MFDECLFSQLTLSDECLFSQLTLFDECLFSQLTLFDECLFSQLTLFDEYLFSQLTLFDECLFSIFKFFNFIYFSARHLLCTHPEHSHVVGESQNDETNLEFSTTLTYCTLQMLAGGFDYKVIATFMRVMSSKNKYNIFNNKLF